MPYFNSPLSQGASSHYKLLLVLFNDWKRLKTANQLTVFFGMKNKNSLWFVWILCIFPFSKGRRRSNNTDEQLILQKNVKYLPKLVYLIIIPILQVSIDFIFNWSYNWIYVILIDLIIVLSNSKNIFNPWKCGLWAFC